MGQLSVVVFTRCDLFPFLFVSAKEDRDGRPMIYLQTKRDKKYHRLKIGDTLTRYQIVEFDPKKEELTVKNIETGRRVVLPKFRKREEEKFVELRDRFDNSDLKVKVGDEMELRGHKFRVQDYRDGTAIFVSLKTGVTYAIERDGKHLTKPPAQKEAL